MLACVLTLLMLLDGPATPPGTVLPNKEALVATLKEKLAQFRVPLDRFCFELGNGASTSIVHGYYRKTHVQNFAGREGVHVLSPTACFVLLRSPGQQAWSIVSQAELDDVKRKQAKDEWMEKHVLVWNNLGPWAPGNLLGWSNSRFHEGPGWTVHKVTSERVKDKPVYRFHFSHDRLVEGRTQTVRGCVDVDPDSWAIVRTSWYPFPNVYSVHDTEYTYESTIHGIPKLRRMESRSWGLGRDRQYWRPYSMQTVNVTQFTEVDSIDPYEFTLDYYGLGPPYKAIAGIAAGVLVIGGWIYVVNIWRLQRRRRGLSWDVAAPAPAVRFS